ncbi:mitogen-activated protein kinase kinase kinase 3-like isoform X2 [Punica granatum]|uniref:mitogen-activated protein kinase kinase kinase n=1 Tax=Punica granatum TaxID=22663 RepID=A0A6P8E3W0_PUNGR|nr:mitogen-activated protein kinase kinase kinase 3-like isoform X2 [Punica granatum]
MPAWWPRKSRKPKKNSPESQPISPQSNSHSPAFKSPAKSDAQKNNLLNDHHRHPHKSKDVGVDRLPGGSGFESDGPGESYGLPLPRPSISSTHSLGNENGSGSVSSVSSSGSADDHPLQLGVQRSRSPGPGSRGPTSPTSPHSRFCNMSLESPKWWQEECRSSSHPLPLPPGSPTSPSSVLSPRMPSLENPNSNVSKWKRGKLLGQGTFGNVYIGFNSETGQMCAIKEVRVASDDRSFKESLKQLSQEINLLSQLSHPNIVQYYGSELDEETLSVYLEYVSGGSIHKLLQEYGPLNEPVIQNYTRQIISGLAYLHRKSVVHRDVKGANILVGTNGEIKLADFGMAKHITACASMLSFKGSPYWMAPEVVMNTNGYSFAVDIWSLGCTILEMATSKPPWSQYEGVAAIFKIGNSKEIPKIPDHLSSNAKSFIRLCLQREPQARPTALQLLDHPFVRATDGSGTRTPPALDLHSERPLIAGPADLGYEANPAAMSSRALRSPRESFRAITSLPVSPCSSPLRQFGATHRSCFPSPPHPYSSAGRSGYSNNNTNNIIDFCLYPTTPNRRYSFDPWQEASPFRTQTPGGSPPRSRII